MSRQANVTLKSKGGLIPPDRVLKLNPKASSISIGRASKSAAKNLTGSVDNAWFASPVMSRHHATLSLDPQKNVLNIKDVGSMHGTFLNGMRLPVNKNTEIINGSELTFGQLVQRGSESFPPCEFSINYNIVPWRSSNAYTVPDTSDEEDEDDDDDISDEDTRDDSTEDVPSVKNKSSSTTSSPLPSHPASSASCPIDLTEDTPYLDSEKNVMHNDKTWASKNYMSPSTSESPPGQSVATHTPSKSGILKIDSDSEEDDDYASDLENKNPESGQPPVVETIDISRISAEAQALPVGKGEDIAVDKAFDAEQLGDSDDEVMVDINGRNEDMASMLEHNDWSADSESDDDVESIDAESECYGSEVDETNEVPFDDIDDENDANLAQPGGTEEIFAGFSDEESDDHSDLGLSEDGNEAQEEMTHQNLLGPTTDSPCVGPRSGRSSIRLTQRCPVVDPSGLSLQNILRVTQQSAEYDAFTPKPNYMLDPVPRENPFPIFEPCQRLPSPSDAAMVKTPGSALEKAAAVPTTSSLTTASETSLKSLAEKTGKHAYFEAREENKAKNARFEFEATWNADQRETSVDRELAAEARELQVEALEAEEASPSKWANEAEVPRVNSKPGTRKRHLSKPVFAASYPAWNKSSHPPVFQNFDLTMPSIFSSGSRTPTCTVDSEPDMTSAATFNTSKAAMAAAKPRGLSIKEIINSAPQEAGLLQEQESQQEPTKLTKRKFQDISDTQGEQFARATFEIPDSQEPSQATTDPGSQVVAAAVTQNEDRPRPTKRFKKFVEAVGYAALGGAAVGAGLFSVLVATAPDFL